MANYYGAKTRSVKSDETDDMCDEAWSRPGETARNAAMDLIPSLRPTSAQCVWCTDAPFDTVTGLFAHQDEIHRRKCYACQYCRWTDPSGKVTRTHMQDEHGDRPLSTEVYRNRLLPTYHEETERLKDWELTTMYAGNSDEIARRFRRFHEFNRHSPLYGVPFRHKFGARRGDSDDGEQRQTETYEQKMNRLDAKLRKSAFERLGLPKGEVTEDYSDIPEHRDLVRRDETRRPSRSNTSGAGRGTTVERREAKGPYSFGSRDIREKRE